MFMATQQFFFGLPLWFLVVTHVLLDGNPMCLIGCESFVVVSQCFYVDVLQKKIQVFFSLVHIFLHVIKIEFYYI